MKEFAPAWRNPHMTAAQVRKYIKDMKKAQELAKKKLEEAQKKWELDESSDLRSLEELMEDL